MDASYSLKMNRRKKKGVKIGKKQKHNKNPHDTPRKWAGQPLITFPWLQKKIKKTLV